MLAEALKVVEAARALEPVPGSAGLYRISCEPRHIHRFLRELAESIEGFDRAAAHGMAAGPDARSLLGKALRYAADQGVDMKAMTAALAGPPPQGGDIADADDLELVPKPGEVGAPDRIQDVSVSRQASRDGAAATGRVADLAAAYESDPRFPGTSAGPERPATPITGTSSPLDPTESNPDAPKPKPPAPQAPLQKQPSDQSELIKQASDRLEALAVKHGWTPKLKELDAALRLASQAMAKNVSPTGDVAYLLSEEAVRALGKVEEDLGEIEMGRDAPEADDEYARRGPAFF